MTRVLLINSNTESAPYPVSPLGLGMIATSLKKAGYEVKLFDGLWNRDLGSDDKIKALDSVLTDFQPEVIGVSVRNIDDVIMQKPIYYIDEIEKLCIEPIKKYGKGITILGGSGYSLFPYELLERWKFDFGIVGPGEKIMVSLLNSLNSGNTEKIPGVLVRGIDGQITGNLNLQLPQRKSDLQIPFPQIDLHLNYIPYLGKSAYPIQTKRGCALKCLYCSYPNLEGKIYQLRSPKDVVDEIEILQKRLPKITIEFVDSTFNHPPDHAENICREIIDRGLQLRLRTMGINPAGVTPELISLMKQAGFTQIDCTPDSGSEKMLKNLRKGFNRKVLEKTARLIRESNMPTMWFFVLGGPGEDDKSLDETFSFIENHIDEHDLVHLTEGLRIYPDTGLYEVAIEEGLVSKEESLLKPRFYVSQQLGQENLRKKVQEFTATHYNCLRSVETGPTPGMIKKAMEIRERENLTDEPMFRTLLRLRKEMMKNGIDPSNK